MKKIWRDAILAASSALLITDAGCGANKQVLHQPLVALRSVPVPSPLDGLPATINGDILETAGAVSGVLEPQHVFVVAIPVGEAATGSFHSFRVYGFRDVKPVLLDTVAIKANLMDLKIEHGELFVWSQAYLQSDPACCPSQLATDKYRLLNNKLSIAAPAVVASAQPTGPAVGVQVAAGELGNASAEMIEPLPTPHPETPDPNTYFSTAAPTAAPQSAGPIQLETSLPKSGGFMDAEGGGKSQLVSVTECEAYAKPVTGSVIVEAHVAVQNLSVRNAAYVYPFVVSGIGPSYDQGSYISEGYTNLMGRHTQSGDVLLGPRRLIRLGFRVNFNRGVHRQIECRVRYNWYR